MRAWIYFFITALCGTCSSSELNLKLENSKENKMSDSDQLVDKSFESFNNTDVVLREHNTVVNNTVEMDTKGACSSANGTLDVDFCIHYIQRLIQNQLPKDLQGLDRVTRVLTELTLPICLDGFKVVHFNPESQICCDGVFSKRNEHRMCCHGEIIDDRVNLCCDDIKHEKNENNGCCGRFEYDTRKHACCGGMLYNISQNQGVTETTLTGNCFNTMNISGKCMSCVNDTQLEIESIALTELCCEGTVRNRSYVSNNGRVEKNASEDQDIIVTLSHRINGSDDIIKYTLIGAAVGGSAFISICGITLGCFRYCRRRGILYMCLNKSTQYRVPEITLADFTISSESSLFYHRDETEYSMQENSPLDEFDSRNIQTTSTRNIYVRRTDDSTSTNSVVSNSTSLDIPTLRDLEKYSLINEGNLKMDFFQDSHTQTKTSNFETRRTIFGTPFDCTYVLDDTNPILQMPYSDAQMNLPISMTKAGQVEVSASTFRNIEATKKKLGLPDDEFIASPVVEYAINGAGKLDGYACVRLPFVGNVTNLKVKKFESDEGLETAAKSTEIPSKGKQNECLDAYYIVEGSAILIYTNSFSGFYITWCGHRRELDLIAFIFGSYKWLNYKYEVFITVYVADIIFKIQDYKEEMFENEEKRQGRKCLRSEIHLQMPDCDLDGKDYIEACLSLKSDEDKRKWMHVIHPDRGTPVYPLKQKIRLENIAQKCQNCQHLHTHRNNQPVCRHWYLNTVENTLPSEKFQCYVDLTVWKKDTDTYEPNCITIDELELRAADRHRIKDSIPVQETVSPFGACAPRASQKSTRNTGIVCELPLSSRQIHTLVRPESEPNLNRNSRHNPPSPELSHVNVTNAFQALPYKDTPVQNDSQS